MFVNVQVCKDTHVFMSTYTCVYMCISAKCYLLDVVLQKASTLSFELAFHKGLELSKQPRLANQQASGIQLCLLP